MAGPAVAPKSRIGSWPGALAILLAAIGSGEASAAESVSLEVAVKATYIGKLIPFVEWPEGPSRPRDAPFNICVLGDDPVARTVGQATAAQKSNELPLIARALAEGAAAADCQVLYVSGPEGRRAAAIETVRNAPILTITDEADSAKGIINFVTEEGRVRLQIDQAASTRAGLKIDTRLLAMAAAARSR